MQDMIKKYSKNNIFALNYGKNAGKGHAVMTGMKYTKGAYILMLDADGATEVEDYAKLRRELDTIKTEEDLGIAIGSRFHLDNADNVKVERTIFRKILGSINNLFVKQLIGLKEINDTQCGFKLFSRKAANKIVFNMHLTRWAFDVEMLYIANGLNIPVKEIPVNWREIEGSKLNIFTASLSFFRDYFAIIIFYSIGFWRLVV